MIHLFWVIPSMIAVWMGVSANRRMDDIAFGAMVGMLCLFFGGAISIVAIAVIYETAYTDNVKFIELNDIPYVVKITEPDDGWQKDLLRLTDSYEFIEVAE